MLSDLIALLVALGIVTSPTAVYALVTRSAGIYQTTRQFWMVLLVSLGISYLLIFALAWFAHISLLPAVIVSAIVPFLVGNVFSKGDVYGGEGAPNDASEEAAEEDAVDGEDDEDMQEETAGLAEDHAARFARFSDLLN